MNAAAKLLTPRGLEPIDLAPISFPAGLGWYVVRTNVKCESRAKSGLISLGYDAFLPVEKVWIKHARRKTEKIRPLLPRYLFVGFDINRTPWQPILDVDGVEKVLISATQIPLKVPNAAIEKITNGQYLAAG